MATVRQFRALALACVGAVEGAHHDHPDFRANGRVFGTLLPDGRRAMVKLTPEQQRVRLQALGDVLEPAAGAWGRQGCTLVRLAAVDTATLGDLVTDAWQNVMQAPARSPARKPARTKKTRTKKTQTKKTQLKKVQTKKVQSKKRAKK